MNREILRQKISRSSIEKLKSDNQALLSFVRQQCNGEIVYVLEKFGKLDNDSSKQPLLDLLSNTNDIIRILAIKNLAKLVDITLLGVFDKHASEDQSTEVRREAVSAIGRLRDKSIIPTLIRYLSSEDPKITLQAIRGLLVFAKHKAVQHQLKKLVNHPNELIRAIIEKETCSKFLRNTSADQHDQHPQLLKNIVVEGDAIEVLRHAPDDSVHLTFTSPPYYNARDYSIYKSYSEYLNFLETVFREVYRLTKEGRFFILNTSPIIIPRMSRAHASKRYPIPYDIHPLLINMGWEFIDDIVWVKPEASAKNRNAGFFQHRKPLAYKPNAISEMLMVYRKKTDRLIDWNIKQYDQEKVEASKIIGNYETNNIWYIDPTFDKVHSAVFPQTLCDRIIRYYSFIEDLILDPFAGSGTLGRSALSLNRNFFLIEKEEKYVDRIRRRLVDSLGPLKFTDCPQPKTMKLAEFTSLWK